jgi:AcrR family transcriptional regulator
MKSKKKTKILSAAAALMGQVGGRSRSAAKVAAARKNGIKGGPLGGRPRKSRKGGRK